MKHITLDRGKLNSELKNALIFQSLSGAEIESLTMLCDVFEYESGEVILKQGSVSPYIYLIFEGRVDVIVQGNEEGVRVSKIRSGDIFGESSIFLDQPRTASVVADGPAILSTLSRKQLIGYINDNPRAGIKILSFIIYSLLRKLDCVNKDYAMEKEATVTLSDIEDIKKFFPKSLDEMIGGN